MSESPLGTVSVALSPLERFKEYLQSRGKRWTEPRRIVLEEVFSRHEHFDAESLIEHIERKVGRATVYRTLKEFVDAGLLRKFELDGRAVYEHDYGYPQHDHLHCTQCQQLIEFQSDDLLRIRDVVAQEHNFRIASHRLI
ncbi:MAG: transcriptional repressor, partial [Planctomycetes bacterium]|nr:transcriptional repressor [Planctomycetota bacterium]